MIQILTICNKIDRILADAVEANSIRDYRVYLRKNENLYIYIIGDTIPEKVESKIAVLYPNIELELVSTDIAEDAYYKSLFEPSEKVVLDNGRRRNSSIWAIRPSSKQKKKHIPVVSFYSYKGGMGRTTTLVAYATYLAIHHSKKVVVVDFDLEAPGLTNFFLKYPAEQNQRNGLVEYMFDKELSLASQKNIKDYVWEADHAFSGEGTIYVMPAGNMGLEKVERNSKTTHLDHYVEGVARLDINDKEYASKIFLSLLEDLNTLNPDIILLDSKTGISDIMGIAVCTLSDLSVGFFRSDAQSLPGLHFFINLMMTNKNVEPFIVNSILPTALTQKKNLFDQLCKSVEDAINTFDDDANINFPCFPISRQSDFEILGTVAENLADFSEVIRNNDIKDYAKLFEVLTSRVLSENKDAENADELYELRDGVLNHTQTTLSSIDLYAENQSVEEDLNNYRFYYRRCMNDLLNTDKYLIVGSKGTGKSYIYNALKNRRVVDLIKNNTGKSDDYVFLYTIDKRDRIFDVAKFQETTTIEKYRFWLIYTWNILVSDIKLQFPDFKLSQDLEYTKLQDDDTTRIWLYEKMQNEEYVLRIEKEQKRLDDYLSRLENTTYLTIIYDQLDEIVSPSKWSEWIPELIKYWRVKHFSFISGKLFVRRDLVLGLVGLTNINDILNQAIDIEWKTEEIYSYFFYVTLAENKCQDFWKLMNLYGRVNREMITRCQSAITSTRVPVYEREVLEALVDTYFGQTIDPEGTLRMGKTYDWFYKNLKNADDTFSLRPFISLLTKAVVKQLNDNNKEEEIPYPIILQKCYINKVVRSEAVVFHLEDLFKNAKGTMPIKYVFDYISDNPKQRYHFISMRKQPFEEILNNVIQLHRNKEEMHGMTVETLITLMITNGIVAKCNYGSGVIYKFSFLYKYKLKLRGS